jgi:hypothetical protein
VHATVFVPRGRAGPIARRLYVGAWSVWKHSSVHLPLEQRRHRLALLGPLLVPLTFLVWGSLLIVGFALIYYPWAEAFVIPPELDDIPAWGSALYYSAYSATTLGVGDIFPQGLALRLVSVLEGAYGFALITVSISYLLSTYSALNRATALALEISQFVGRVDGRDPVDVLITVAQLDNEHEIVHWMGRALSIFTTVVQSEGQYPLLHCFHVPDDDRALPVAITDLLEVVVLARSLLLPAHFPLLSCSSFGAAIERTARRHFDEGARMFGSEPTDDSETKRERRRSYLSARKRLETAGVRLREDAQAWSTYARLRASWDYQNHSIRVHFGYPELP